MGTVQRQSESRLNQGVLGRAITYGGLGLILVTLGTQVASPKMPVVAAASVADDAATLLPPLPLVPTAPDVPAPSAALFEMTLAYPADGDLAALLVKAGAIQDQARQAAELWRQDMAGSAQETPDVKLALGASVDGGSRMIERLTILTDVGRTVIARSGAALRIEQDKPQTEQIEVSIGSGDVFQALRRAGLDPRLALEAAALLEKQAVEARRVTAVIAERPDRFDGPGTPQLLYLASAREGRRPLQLLRWPGTPGGWIDIDHFGSDDGFLQPVSGRVSSRFGSRFHPVLRFLRPHQGVDFAATWGAPVRAAADGRVVGAGWSGGYGRQVRLDHGDTMMTSYSHLSSMIAAPGSWVRRGQIVGYVGASGLATGPHLHFEILRSGQRIDPLGARLIDASNAANRAAVAARLAQLRIAGA